MIDCVDVVKKESVKPTDLMSPTKGTTVPPIKENVDVVKTSDAVKSTVHIPTVRQSTTAFPYISKTVEPDIGVVNDEVVAVPKSITPVNKGAVIALALGISITVILLIFAGCRFRRIHKRARKGRSLNSNDADYLINGMYL